MTTATVECTITTTTKKPELKFDAESIMRFAELAKTLTESNLTIEDLIATAKAKKNGIEPSLAEPAPVIQYITMDKPDLNPLPIGDAFDDYTKHYVIARNAAPGTIKHWKYMKHLCLDYFCGEANEHIRAHEARENIQDITYKDSLEYQTYLATWLRPDTVRKAITALRCVLDWCDAAGYKVIKSKFVNVPRHEKREPKCLDIHEVREFIDLVSEPHHALTEQGRLRNIAICEVLISSGVRISELQRLNRDSIKNRAFSVLESKSKKGRPCFISRRAERAIKKYLETRTDRCPALFISTENDRRLSLNGIRGIFKYVCQHSHFDKIHPHTFRHSFATHLLNNNVDLITIARMLGHEDVQTTQIYTHVTNPHLRAVHDRIMARI